MATSNTAALFIARSRKLPGLKNAGAINAIAKEHNLVVIEKGDNREGTNRDTSSGHFHGTSPDPAATAAAATEEAS